MADKMRCRRVFAFALVLASEVSARRFRQNADDAVVSASDDSAAVPVVPAAVVAVPEGAVVSQAATDTTEALDVSQIVPQPDLLIAAADPIAAAGDLSTADVDQVVAAAAATVSNNYDVIIIGAGLAGLKAAFDLQSKNYSVVVLEGRDRIGGRVYSTKLTSSTGIQSTYPVEIGAQWFHGSVTSGNNAVHELVVKNLSIIPIQSGNSGGLYNSTSMKEILDPDLTDFQEKVSAVGRMHDGVHGAASLQGRTDGHGHAHSQPYHRQL